MRMPDRSRLDMALKPGGDSLIQIFLDTDYVDHVKDCECGRCKLEKNNGN